MKFAWLVPLVIANLRCSNSEAVTARYQARLDLARTGLLAQMISPTCGPTGDHTSDCGLLDGANVAGAVERFATSSCPDGQVTDACVAQFIADRERRLAVRYFRASRQDVEQRCDHNEKCGTIIGYELVWLELHNQSILDEIDATRTQLSATAAEEIESSHRRRRRVAHAIGAGLQTFGSSIARSNDDNRASGCANDYACRYGFTCVKGVVQATGYCAQNVNSTGTPTLQPAHASSSGSCLSLADCSPGFRCDIPADNMRGFCVR